MVNISTPKNTNNNVTVSSPNTNNTVNTLNSVVFSEDLSQQWAVKLDGKVKNEDYSSKYYATKSKEYSESAQGYKEEIENEVKAEINSQTNVALDAINSQAQVLKDGLVSTAEKQANIATEQANIAIAQTELVASTTNKALEDIEILTTNSSQTLESLSATSVQEINTAKTTALSQITTEGAEQIANIESTGFYMRDDKLYYINSEGVETEFESGGGSGFNLFDTKVSDHILEGYEALGWALQGTYVYKEGVAGSRYGYPDFYDRCLEEYESAEYDNSLALDWTQPTLSANGTLGGSSFAVIASSELSANNPAYKVFNGTTTDGNDCWHSNSESNSWVTFYNPTAIKVTKLQITNRNDGYTYPIYGGVVYGSNDNSDWEQITTFTNSVLGSNATWNIDLSTNKNYYKYYKIEANNSNTYVTIGKVVITAKEISLPIKKNVNGHVFYDIANKEVIDNRYAITGSAWFYGIDTENERIFLPRENNRYLVESKKATNTDPTWYNLYSDGFCEQGGYTPSKGVVTLLKAFVNTNYYVIASHTSYSAGIDALGITAKTNTTFTISAGGFNGANWQACGYVAEIPDVLPQYKYICVGNTNVQSSVTNITEITTSENDTLPLFHNFYSNEDMTTTGAYVNASLGSWLSGNVYTTAYQELVNKLGTDNVKSNTDSFTDYDFVVNQDDITFRLPLLNGDENVIGENSAVVDLGTPATKTYIDINQNGVLYAYGTSSASNQHLGFTIYDGVSGKTMDGIRISSSASSQALVITKEVFKGQRAQIIYTIGTLSQYRFTPYVGNGSLYYKVANAVTNLELLDASKVTSVLNTCYKRNDGDNSDLSGLGMPSNKYVELTIGASGTTYTAPANGYFNVYGLANGGQGWIYLQNNNKGTTCQPSNSNQNGVNGFIPVSKGDVVYVQYINITWSAFRFYYAQGAESEAL